MTSPWWSHVDYWYFWISVLSLSQACILHTFTHLQTHLEEREKCENKYVIAFNLFITGRCSDTKATNYAGSCIELNRMKQKEEQILLWILWNGQTDCPLTFLNGIYVKYLPMALRHSDAAMLMSLPFIYINWVDIWMHISYNCALKKS